MAWGLLVLVGCWLLGGWLPHAQIDDGMADTFLLARSEIRDEGHYHYDHSLFSTHHFAALFLP